MEHSNTPLAADVIASGIHDAKNNMFDALARISSAIQVIREGHGNDALPILTETEQAVLASAERLSKLLSAYRLTRHENPVSLLPVNVQELLEDAVLRIAPHRHADLVIESRCDFDGFWICDRELVTDCLVNALQNALRVAKHQIRIEAAAADDQLELTVADDGPGFPDTLPAQPSGERTGIGLYIARRIAHLHVRHDHHGQLKLENGGPLGGAIFRLILP